LLKGLKSLIKQKPNQASSNWHFRDKSKSKEGNAFKVIYPKL